MFASTTILWCVFNLINLRMHNAFGTMLIVISLRREKDHVYYNVSISSIDYTQITRLLAQKPQMRSITYVRGEKYLEVHALTLCRENTLWARLL